MNVSALELIVALVAVFLGSLVQGSIGFGLGIIGAPFIALVVPAALPASLVLVAFPHTIASIVREHHAIELLSQCGWNQTPLFLRLSSLQSIWQFSGVVGPPRCHGVMWSASMPSSSNFSLQTGQIPFWRSYASVF